MGKNEESRIKTTPVQTTTSDLAENKEEPQQKVDKLIEQPTKKPDNFLVLRPLRKVYQLVGQYVTPYLAKLSAKITKKHKEDANTESETKENTAKLPHIIPDDAVVQTYILLATIFGLFTGVLGLTKQWGFLSLGVFITASFLLAALFRKIKHRFHRFRRTIFILALLVTAVGIYSLYRQIVKDQSPTPVSPLVETVSTNEKFFHLVHRGAFNFPDFPGRLLYAYNGFDITRSASSKFIAPIGLALNVEAVNKRSTITKIDSYLADVYTDKGKWIRIHSLPMKPPRDIYLVGRSLADCQQLEFTPIFDVQASNKTLQPGDSVEGYMLFEWPHELRRGASYSKIRISVKNSQGETEVAIFDSSLNKNPPGSNQLHENGGLGGKDDKITDLSSLRIRPLMDNK